MPKIQANPKTQGSDPDETRERILRAAAEVFAEKGYAASTTRELAAAAGVNEVTLFRHFGSKSNLLTAVIDEFSALPDISATLAGGFTGDYRQDLTRIGTAFMVSILERQEAMRLMLCEASEVREVMAEIPRRLRQMLTAYLGQLIEAGQVRDLDPELMAQAFLGMFFAYGVGHTILGGPAAPQAEVEELMEVFVEVFIHGTQRVA
jgi:AcrR family transcriptional regulator